MGASPMSLVVNSAARISSVFSSIPTWILRHTRRLVPPCLRAFHSPSPSTLMPVLSISRCSGPSDPTYGMLTCKVVCRRERVLKLGTTQSNPLNRSRLSTNPVVCLSAMPNSTFIVRHVWIPPLAQVFSDSHGQWLAANMCKAFLCGLLAPLAGMEVRGWGPYQICELAALCLTLV